VRRPSLHRFLSSPAAAPALLLIVLAAGCGGPEETRTPAALSPAEPVDRPVRGGTAVIGISADLDSLNPYLSRQALTRDVAYQIFETLMEEQADFGDGPPSFEPALAASWDISGDGLAITFHLRKDAVWSDGVPVTAADVRFSWQAAVHPDVAWLGAEAKEFIRDAEVVDTHTVRFHFTRVYPYQLMDANDGVILPRHIWEPIPFDEWRTSRLDREPVCSGPFRVERWAPGQFIELARNERHDLPGRPLLDRVVFLVIPDAASGLEQLLAGEIDFWDKIEPRHMERLQRQPDVLLHRYPDRYYGFLAWNCVRPLFSDPEVRRALTLAMDRQRIVADLFRGTAEPASGPIPPLYWAHDGTLKPYPHDPAAARQLLEAAGWIDRDGDGWRDRNGVPFRFELQVNAESSLRQDMALMIQEDLRQVGLDVQPVVLERRTAGALQRAHDFDAFIGGWRLPTKVDLAVTFATASVEEGVNYGRYSNDELDALLAQSEQAADFRDAKPLLDRAQRLLRRDQPYTFLYWRERLVAFSTLVRDVQPNSQSPLFHLDQWWIPPDSRRP
jgi:peptide/nickel transport system substrate-binding protein